MNNASKGSGTAKPRIILVQPNFSDYQVYISPYLTIMEPISLEILSSIVKDIADVMIVDRRIDSEKALSRAIATFNPDIVGVTTHSAGERNTSLRVLSVAKKHNPDILTIVGGAHPTLLPEDYCHSSADLVSIGYAEKTFYELVTNFRHPERIKEIKGLAINSSKYSGIQEQMMTPNRPLPEKKLDLPKPDRSLIRKYIRHYKQGIVLSTRGCPFRCSFCALWKVAQGKYLTRPPEEVVDDIKDTPQKVILLADDNTFHDIKRAERIYQLMKEKKIKKKIICYGRSDTIVKHPEIFKKWKSIGLHQLVVGFEAVTEEDLKKLNKSASLDTHLQAIRILQDIGVTNLAHFIVRQDFTEKDFQLLQEFVKKNKIAVPHFPMMTPIPGSDFHKMCLETGMVENFNFELYNFEYMVLKTVLPKDQFYKQVFKLWTRCLSPLRIFSMGRRRDYPIIKYFQRCLQIKWVSLKIRRFYRIQLKYENLARKNNTRPELPLSPSYGITTLTSSFLAFFGKLF